MAANEQRAAYIAAQIESIHQNLRFLETVVREPIGLTTDLLLLREAIESDGAAEERDRQAFQDIVGRGSNPQPVGLAAAAVSGATIDLVKQLVLEGDGSLSEAWTARAVMVLERIEARLGADVRKSAAENLRGGLYVIVDPEQTLGRPVDEVAAAAVKGGAVAIQLRDKKSDKAALLESARKLQQICSDGGAEFIVNDDADIARLSGAGGLHVGQHDLPVGEARKVLDSTQIVGKSNALLEEALESESEGADYVAVGAIYPTETKDETRPAGLETLSKVKSSVAVPVVAIGGIDEENVEAVIEAGADCVCVVRAVCGADDPGAAARRLADIVDQAAG